MLFTHWMESDQKALSGLVSIKISKSEKKDNGSDPMEHYKSLIKVLRTKTTS